MHFDDLAAALEAAIKNTPPEKLEQHQLAITVGMVLGGGYAPAPTIAPLINCIDNTPNLKRLLGLQLHLTMTAMRPFTPSSIAFWLIRMAKESSVAEAINGLENFLEAKEILVRRISSIDGMILSRKCVLDNETYLVPWSELTDTQAKRKALEHSLEQHRAIAAALVQEVNTPKQLLRPDQISSAPSFHLRDYNSDIVMCASLFGPCGAAITSTWWEYPSWVPAEGMSFVLLLDYGRREQTDWPDTAYDSFPGFYKHFLQLEDSWKVRLRIPLQRLNSAMRRWDMVDAAIDSGIAMESLFQSGNNHLLVLRAARYLDLDLEARKKTRELLVLLNKARNSAVHEGKLPSTAGDLSMQSLLSYGFRFIAEALRKVIENGEPDWDKIDLS